MRPQTSIGSDQNASRPDGELVCAAQRGEKRAFVEIVARHQAMVCGIALGILGDFAASELREPARLRPWLAQIARNAALGQLRRKRGEEALDDELVLMDESPTPDEAAANEEEAALVRASLAKLPETYRLPLVLYYREGKSVRAVAEALEISEDAVKQRLARGRDMLQERMSGMIETVLARTGPSAIFTMAIAAAIGALTAPAAVAGSVFAAAASSSTAATSTSSILTAMSTSKSFLAATALVAAVCIPVGYKISTRTALPVQVEATKKVEAIAPTNESESSAPAYESTSLFAEWRELHVKHGTNAEAMPKLYKAISALKDPFRKRAFKTALTTEWAQVAPAAGFAFLLERRSESGARRQLLDEWLAQDVRGVVAALLAGPKGWDASARDILVEIARRLPQSVPEIVARLPEEENMWDTGVRDAFAILAEGGLDSARKTAEAMQGPSRQQALGGIAKAWARTDLDGAITWARALPDGVDRDEVIRCALLGRAKVDPAGALDHLGVVPSGERQGWFATSTGARVLSEAAAQDFDATVSWMVAHPGRVTRVDLMGLSQIVGERLSADAIGFLANHANDGSLKALLPAVENALMNNAGGQQSTVWDWLKTQPETDTLKSLRMDVLQTSSYADPLRALRMFSELPEGSVDVQVIAASLLNGSAQRLDSLLTEAPEPLRKSLLEDGFGMLHAETLEDPQRWVARLALLPDAMRAEKTEMLARVWAGQRPEEAIGWAQGLSPRETRDRAMGAAVSGWAANDPHAAGSWVSELPVGATRDHAAGALVSAVADRFPQEAWELSLNIQDEAERYRAATYAIKAMYAREPATARQWIEASTFPTEFKLQLQKALEMVHEHVRSSAIPAAGGSK